MKKIFGFLTAAVALSMAVASCSTEGLTIPVDPSEETFTLTFHASLPPVTKATLTPEGSGENLSFKAAWEEGDALKVTIAGDEYTATWNGSAFVIDSVPTDLQNATVSVSAVYPAETPTSEVRAQEGTAYNSLYDTMECTGKEVTLGDAGFVLPMKRTTAIYYFNLASSLDEAITSATLSIGSTEIKTVYSGLNAKNAVLWFNFTPGTYNDLKLEAETESHKLSISNETSTEYEKGKVYVVEGNASSLWEEKATSVSYKKVTSEPENGWAGEYLIAYCPDADTARVFNGLDAASDYVATTINDNAISPEDGMVVVSIESMTGGYSLKIVGGEKDGNYIYGKSGSNSIQYGSTAVANTISISDGLVTIESNSTSFRYNAAANNDRFRFYKTTTTGASYICPTLFKREGNVPVVNVTGVSLNPTSAEIEVGEDVELVATITPENATNKTVTWESSNTDVATVSNGVVTGVAAGTATITVTTKDGGKQATCSVTVNEVVVDEVTISEFLAKTVSEDKWYKLTGTVSNIVSDTYGNFTLTDATGSVYVYGLTQTKVDSNDKTFKGLGINTGDTVTLIGKRDEHSEEAQVGGAYYVSHVPAPSISLNPSSLSFIAAGESKNVTVAADNFAGTVTITAESNNTQFTTSVSGTTITITAAENTSSSDIEGVVTITATDGASTKSAEVAVTQYGAEEITDAVDVLNRELTGVTATSYTDWSDKKSNSAARYSGNSAGGNSSIQLRADNPSGIVTTVSGGYVTKVSVEWESHTTNGRTLQVYGSNTAYSSAGDLRSNDKKGTLLGTIVYGTSTELTISGQYQYIGLCSASGSMYLTSISISWSATAPEAPVLSGLTWTGYTSSYTAGSTFAIDGTIKAIYDNGSEVELSADDVELTTAPDLSAVGLTTAVISYTDGEVTKTATANITVTKKTDAGTTGTVRITRDCFPSGTLAYNVTDSWSAKASTGETVSGEGDLYSSNGQTTMQSKNSGVSTMYHNTVAVPGSITKITLKCASGTTRTYTAYMNKTTVITSTSGGTSKGTIAPKAGETASLSLDAADGWHYFWLNLAGGASYLDYIEIEYVTD